MNRAPHRRRFYLVWLFALMLLSSIIVCTYIYYNELLSLITPAPTERLIGTWKSTQLVPSEEVQFTPTGETTLSLSEGVQAGEAPGRSPVVKTFQGTYHWIDEKIVQINLIGKDGKVETVTVEVFILTGATRSDDQLRMRRTNGAMRTYRRSD